MQVLASICTIIIRQPNQKEIKSLREGSFWSFWWNTKLDLQFLNLHDSWIWHDGCVTGLVVGWGGLCGQGPSRGRQDLVHGVGLEGPSVGVKVGALVGSWRWGLSPATARRGSGQVWWTGGGVADEVSGARLLLGLEQKANWLKSMHKNLLSNLLLSPLQYRSRRIFLSNCSHGSFLRTYWTNFDPNSRGFSNWLVLVLCLNWCG